MVRGELRQKLVVRDAGGRIQPCLGFDLRADREGDVTRERNALQVFRDVVVGLVQRKRFNDRRVLREYLTNLLGNRRVSRRPSVRTTQDIGQPPAPEIAPAQPRLCLPALPM
jgi:hypothetical protein